jgi:SRSO17 transposase
MQLPIVTPAPLVKQHAAAFRDLFSNRRQFRHFENYLTGLTVLPNKSLANIARCIVDSADKSNLSRFLSEAAWPEAQVNERRLAYLLEQTTALRDEGKGGYLILDDTLCEHVGSLFDYIDRHYHQGENTFPLAHNLVTSHYVNGPVRFPVDLRLYRRYDELTQWEGFVAQHFPERPIPTTKKERAQLHKEVDPVLRQDAAFLALHQQFRTKLSLAVELIEQAVQRALPFSVVLFDGWYLAPEVVAVAQQHHKDWVSLLKKNRKLETNSFVLKDAAGKPLPLPSPHIKLEALVPLIPATAYRKVQLEGQDYWCFTLTVRIPGLGKVRLVISFDNPALRGTYAVLVTNRTDWSATHLLRVYLQRWPIETFYQDAKQHLGLDEYRMRSAEAISKHWCLVYVAYSFLHLDCLPASLKDGPAFPIKSIGEACRQQSQALIQALILHAHQHLSQGLKVHELFNLLFAKQSTCRAT